MEVFQYPARQDNYNFVISCKKTGFCAGIDIDEVEPFFEYIEKNELNLQAILNTHHHLDHTGGNEKIIKKFPNLPIYGSKYDLLKKRIYAQNRGLAEGDEIKIGSIILKVIEIPGHTLGHLCYYNESVAFVGDTLFASGCGRLFEGTPEQMIFSLEKIRTKISEKTKIYCGHEYTLANLRFASSLNKEYFEKYFKEIESLRKEGKYSVPTNLQREKKYNPFLLVLDHAQKEDILGFKELNKVSSFAKIRQKKDLFS